MKSAVSQLNEFHLKTGMKNYLLPFDQFMCIMLIMPNLQRLAYDILYDLSEHDLTILAYVDGT
jgi:hypothetical protein